MAEICAVYRITNTITGDFYVGSSKDVKRRWASHKCPSTWNKCPNNPLYKDMQKYGLEKFDFEVIEEVEESFLKKKEQKFIETLKPTYNNYNANGLNVERYKEAQKKAQKKYEKSDKGKESQKKANNKYQNQLCSYNGDTLTLNTVSQRFRRQGIEHPVIEAKKYLIKDYSISPSLRK